MKPNSDDTEKRCEFKGHGGSSCEWLMVRWHKDEADASRKRHASAVGGAQGNGKGGATVVRKQQLRQQTG